MMVLVGKLHPASLIKSIKIASLQLPVKLTRTPEIRVK